MKDISLGECLMVVIIVAAIAGFLGILIGIDCSTRKMEKRAIAAGVGGYDTNLFFFGSTNGKRVLTGTKKGVKW